MTCIQRYDDPEGGGLQSKASAKAYIKRITVSPFCPCVKANILSKLSGHRIPEWREEDIIEYLAYLIDQLDDKYKEIFNAFKELVVKGIEKNPREVKRFINSYVATREVFELDPGILMLLQVFQFRRDWIDFYNRIFEYEDFRQAVVKKFV
jgi:hypothetical protein